MELQIIKLRNSNGLYAEFSNYGARWLSMFVPDRYGEFDDVLLGFDSMEDYVTANEKYYGAIVGRVCGRIKNSHFVLNNKEYFLTQNENRHHLHGGMDAFHIRMWDAYKGMNDKNEEYVLFTYKSKDGEEGYPGDLVVSVWYTLTSDNRLRMECKAVCNKDTIVNITNHAFFNLCGLKYNSNILGHRLFIDASNIIDCDEELIPTGKLFNLSSYGIDLRQQKSIDLVLKEDVYNIRKNNGFSLAYAIDNYGSMEKPVVRLQEPIKGRSLKIYTNQPSIQVYTGYMMDGHDIGKNSTPYFQNAGIALEPQGYPDAVNNYSFPSIILRKDEVYTHITDYEWCVFD